MSDTTDKGNPSKTGPASPDRGVAADKERVAKVMARAGLCSRRDAEVWIKAGRVAVNGKVIESPALNVGPDDRISVDGNAVEARERTRLFLYHKPRGLVTTAKDTEGRPTVFDNLPEDLPRLVSVGRLDINTEGLLLLTNDGGLARVLELPATGWLRRYRVRANGRITPERLEALTDGVTVDGVTYAGIEATLDRTQGANVWLTMGLREGKNREIKKVLEHLGLYVNRLIRLSFGPFQLGELAEGEVEEVRSRVLRDQLGEELAREAGVDWEGGATAPVVTHARLDTGRDKPTRPGSAGAERGARRPGSSKLPDRAPPAPRRDRPAPNARPHVTAMRAERPNDDSGPRKRITRAKTEDRKGRAVTVERITTEGKHRHSGEGGTSRNARNFARDRRDALVSAAPQGETGRRSRRRPAETDEQPRAQGRTSRGFGAERPQTGRALKDGKRGRAGSPPRSKSGDGGPPRPGPRSGSGSRGRPGPRGPR